VTISTISDRTKAIRKHKKLSQQAFSDFLGIKRGTLASIEAKGDNPPYSMLVAISTLMPEISIVWLLTGKGEMYATHADDSLSMEQVQLLEMYSMLSDEQKREIFDAIEVKQKINSEFKRLQNEIDSLKKAM